MHYTAEYGIAAHWKYKLGMGAGGKGESTRLAENIEKVKNMILDQLEAEDVTDIAKISEMTLKKTMFMCSLQREM